MTPITHCREVLRRSGSSFAVAFRFLPGAERDAMTAFYAFCRAVDDAVDDAPDTAAAERALTHWRAQIEAVYRGQPTDLVALALQQSAERFGLERAHLELVLDGVAQDLDTRRYATFEALYHYCYRVASSVGFVCVSVLGDRSPEALHYAELCGIAVQLTNILRDVAEDARRDRIYLPGEDLAAFGVTEAELLAAPTTPSRRVHDLLCFEGQRAREYYRLAQAALPEAARHRLYFAEALRETYQRLQDELSRADYPVFERRVSLSKKEKLTIALKRRLHPQTLLRSF